MVFTVVRPDKGAAVNFGSLEAEAAQLRDVSKALTSCLKPPPIQEAYPGMEMTLRFSFNRDGGIEHKPRITYSTPGAPNKVRAAYERALLTPSTTALLFHFLRTSEQHWRANPMSSVLLKRGCDRPPDGLCYDVAHQSSSVSWGTGDGVSWLGAIRLGAFTWRTAAGYRPAFRASNTDEQAP